MHNVVENVVAVEESVVPVNDVALAVTNAVAAVAAVLIAVVENAVVTHSSLAMSLALPDMRLPMEVIG